MFSAVWVTERWRQPLIIPFLFDTYECRRQNEVKSPLPQEVEERNAPFNGCVLVDPRLDLRSLWIPEWHAKTNDTHCCTLDEANRNHGEMFETWEPLGDRGSALLGSHCHLTAGKPEIYRVPLGLDGTHANDHGLVDYRNG